MSDEFPLEPALKPVIDGTSQVRTCKHLHVVRGCYIHMRVGTDTIPAGTQDKYCARDVDTRVRCVRPEPSRYFHCGSVESRNAFALFRSADAG